MEAIRHFRRLTIPLFGTIRCLHLKLVTFWFLTRPLLEKLFHDLKSPQGLCSSDALPDDCEERLL